MKGFNNKKQAYSIIMSKTDRKYIRLRKFQAQKKYEILPQSNNEPFFVGLQAYFYDSGYFLLSL